MRWLLFLLLVACSGPSRRDLVETVVDCEIQLKDCGGDKQSLLESLTASNRVARRCLDRESDGGTP